MNFIKRMLSMVNDEWLANLPVGFGLGNTVMAWGDDGKMHKWNPATSTLLASRRGHAGGLAYLGDRSYPASRELYRTAGGKFVSHFIRKTSSGIEIDTDEIAPDKAYEILTDSTTGSHAWRMTPTGNEALTRLVGGLPGFTQHIDRDQGMVILSCVCVVLAIGMEIVKTVRKR